MKVEIAHTPAEKRKIKSIKSGEAFRYGEDWYIKVGIDDDLIRNFDDFYEEHLLTNMPEPSNYSHAIALMHLTSQSFVYANGEIEVDEWYPLVATLKA